MKTLILMAAGKGTRAQVGMNKVLFKVKNKTILEHTIEKFYGLNIFNQIIIVVSKEDYEIVKNELSKYDVELVIGSNQRYKSVKNGIDKSINNIVYIHDAARPYIEKEDILTVENIVKLNSDIKCFSLAGKIKDSICFVEGNKIRDNINREEIMSLLTPQVINKEEYLKIYNEEILTTDETSLFKSNGYDVVLVETEKNNDKLTTKEDIKKFEVENG